MCCRESLLCAVEAATGADEGPTVVLGEPGDCVESLDELEDEPASLELVDWEAGGLEEVWDKLAALLDE